MKLYVEYFPHREYSSKVRPYLDKVMSTKPLRWGTQKSEECIEVFSNAGGFKARLEFRISEKDIKKYSHFLLTSKKFYAESDSVHERNCDYMESQPVIKETETGRFRNRDKVFVHKIKPEKNLIWGMSDSTNFLSIKGTVEQLVDKFSGILAVPVYHYKTNELVEEWLSFRSDGYLEKFYMDETVKLIDDGFGYKTLRGSGLRSATKGDLQQLPDFAHYPEADFRGDSPYIISREVLGFLLNAGIKSLSICPLLEVESEQYQEYMNIWKSFKERISCNPENEIEYLLG